jgi:P pilus assembly chaperone PapD
MIKNVFLGIILFFSADSFIVAQNKTAPSGADTTEMGISISPSTLRFNAKPGGSQTKTIRVSNDTKKNINFQVAFQDYGIGADGKQDVSVSNEYKNALSKYVVVTPTFIELKPRESKLISVTVDIPPGDAYAIAMWTTLIVDQVTERPKIEIPNANANTMAMGVSTSMGFGINLYQNPPNVIINSVEIQSMKYIKASGKTGNSIVMKAKNTGDGIGYCLYYIELTNLLTGKQSKLKVKQFSIFPGYEKEFSFELPNNLEKGKYSALSVLDFGSKEDLRTAELEFIVD